MSRLTLRSESGGALPMVLLMVVLLSLLLTASAALTRSSAATVRTAAVEQTIRQDMVSEALQQSLRELTPANGQLLGVDPTIDPAGSCVGQLGPYTLPNGDRVRVDCVQATDSGVRTGMSSLLLVGDGSNCAAAGTCVTGQDGGLRLTSNSPLNFAGSLTNVSGAWLSKNSNAEMLNASAERSAVVHPVNDAMCPAHSAASGFESDPRCACPRFGTGSSPCSARGFDRLSADVSRFVQTMSRALQGTAPTSRVTVPTCNSSAQFDPADANSPWVITMESGIVGTTELAALTALTADKGCVGDGSTKQEPLLVLRGVIRIGDGSAAMAPNSTPSVGNTWTINKPTATVVVGAPLGGLTAGVSRTCDANKPGGMLQLAGSTYLRVLTGRMLMCPMQPEGIVLAAPSSVTDAGFAWSGVRTEPLLATQYGLASGEVIKARGLVFAPAAFFRIDAQDKRTAIELSGGTVLRALTLTSNPSTVAQGDFTASTPAPTGTRDVQLRFWDLERDRDLGIVQLLIRGDYPTNPASAFVIKLWRTMW